MVRSKIAQNIPASGADVAAERSRVAHGEAANAARTPVYQDAVMALQAEGGVVG